ncbi:MAG TPA: helix-turn-helix transcriptional regulator [Candidatus Nitrosocosmicus sp.]|nr:helix-turn-helix transcriptional regulator [Candidatus Nitrosocosmicus sp.]
MNINKYVGNKIREYRKKKGMNQTELGKALGVVQGTIAGYEKGEIEVGYNNLFKLVDIFEISVDDLFPSTKSEDNDLLHRALKLADDDGMDLNTDDMLLIKKITEKALELEGDERKKLMDSIRFTIDYFNKMNE